MKVLVNKNQWFDDLDRQYLETGFYGKYDVTWSPPDNFEEMDVTFEELKDFIDKGYGIKINC